MKRPAAWIFALTLVAGSAGATECNRDPYLGSQVTVIHKTLTAVALVDRIERDAAFASRLGGFIQISPVLGGLAEYVTLIYPTLDDPFDKVAVLEATGEFKYVAAAVLGCFATPPGDRFGVVIEYHHAGLGTYFYTANRDEATALDTGFPNGGWARSGKTFRVVLEPGCIPHARAQGMQGAYRFFGKPGVGPSSHVFTIDRRECRIVHDSGVWLYEGSPFWGTKVSSRGRCAIADEIPLHRLWRPFGESNHRFTTDLATVGEMIDKGWVHEGVVMCVKRPPAAATSSAGAP